MLKIKLFISKYISIFKKEGIKGVIQQGGWRILVVLFFFFLIKGLLWLLIPYLFFKGVY